MQDRFVSRHVGVNDSDLVEMLKVIGVDSVEELISQVIPADIRLPKPLDMAFEGLTEGEFLSHIKALGAKNKHYRSFIGMGYYPNSTPPAIVRNILENPAWYTSYTPYQAEISQGRLEALLNFQSAVISLTAMEVSNCSLLDEGTAAAESMFMMHSLRSRADVKAGKNILFVDENIYPQTLDVLMTRSEPLGIELMVDSFNEYEFTGDEFGAIIQYPAANGAIADYSSFAESCHDKGVLVTAVCDILSLALLKAPAEWGADIAVGSTQRFGMTMSYGGPSAAYLATKDKFKRSMPGRIIGVSIDRLGNKALRMALQTREQHIKREKATSNICTAQALVASMAGMYAVYHGQNGVKRIALHAHSHAFAVAEAAEKLGFELSSKCFFDTIELTADADKVQEIAEREEVNFFYPSSSKVRMSFDEVTTLAEINKVVAILAEVAGKEAITISQVEEKVSFCPSMARESEILVEQVFNKYHSETELMRYIKKLERRDISLANSMIALGSCTMKLNSAASMMPITMSEFADMHPFAPVEQAAGYQEMMKELEKDLATITGFKAVSNMPNSGAAGEYSGLMVIRAYHQYRNDSKRNIALIPSSAHGTNPASAMVAGMDIVIVACDKNGNIDVADFRAKAEEHKDNLSCAMITYPSTHGVFELKIRELCDIVHENGGQVYMDGANMNAQVGLTSPGFIGADVCHLNLHKTFAMPHGGGGPGVGTIGVAAHLVKFLPSHSIVGGVGGDEGITAVSSSPWGSAGILPITYGYIKMLGFDGLKRSTEMAILNANYMTCALKSEFDVVYQGVSGRVGHEMILDFRNYKKDFGVETGDIARRLMDYGFHAPTLSFPVHETLMIEPTESESKAELDRFIDSLVSIKNECKAISDPKDNLLCNAPHTAPELTGDEWSHGYSRKEAAYPLVWVEENKFFPYVSRIDGGYGDRNLMCTCAPIESYL